MTGGRLRHIFGKALFVIFFAYFAIDATFATVARPVARWLDRLKVGRRLRRWIMSLRPYPSLSLFIVPFVLLEPVKPVAAYLIATGRYFAGMALLIGGEMLKLVLVERLFSVCRRKLLSIPAFAWAYGLWRRAIEGIKSTAVWRDVKRLMAAAVSGFREFLSSLMRGRPRAAKAARSSRS